MVSAAHTGPFHDKLHGHTYHIEAKFVVSREPIDATVLRDTLEEVTAPLDHATLDEVLGRDHSTAEGIAGYVFAHLSRMDCVRVRVTRQDGSGAEVEA